MENIENKITIDRMKEQEIDLVELVNRLLKERVFLVKCCALAVVVGLVIAFSVPKIYTTTVTLAPEMSDPSKKMGSLSGLAAIAGIDLNSSTGMDAISPDLYPDVVHSTPFILELLPEEVSNLKGTLNVSLYEYMEEHQKMTWWGCIFSVPSKILGWVLGFFTEEEVSGEGINPFQLTKKQAEVVKVLKENIGVSVDKKTFVITVSIQMQDPLISAQIANVVVEKLQNYITTYRTQKAKQDLEFTEKVCKDAREAYYNVQKAYAAFEDANRNIISATYRTEQERIRNEMTLTFNVFSTLAQRQEQDKLKVQEQTPVYTVIEPVTVPLKATSPKKAMILVGCIFLALFGGIGYLFVKDMFQHKFIKDELKAKK